MLTTVAIISLFTVSLYGQNLVWPFDAVGAGYDARTGLPTADIWESKHFSENKTYSSIHTGPTFSVPDYVEIRDVTRYDFSTSTEEMHSLEDYSSYRSKYSNWGIGIWKIGFHMSKQALYLMELFADSTKTVYLVTKNFDFFNIALWPSTPRKARFDKEVSVLPEKIDTDEAKRMYRAFIDAFGTHYFSSVTYGGQIFYYIIVENSYLMKQSRAFVNEQVSLYISYLDWSIGIRNGKQVTKDQIDADFWSKSERKCEFIPHADAGRIDCDKVAEMGDVYHDWIQHAEKTPQLMWPSLYPLSFLLSNSKVRNSLDIASEAYLRNTTL